jgi:3-methyladenine DNA glycosylase AlkD
METRQIRETLLLHADEAYRLFITALKPSRHRIIGVRMPVIRSIAKGFPDPLPYLHTFPFDPDPWYEEVLLASLLAGKLASPDQTIIVLDRLLPLNDGWATNDTLCQSLGVMKKVPDAFLSYLKTKSISENPWDVRFAVVSLMDWYLDDHHIDDVLSVVQTIDRGHPYVMLAAAWLLATAVVPYPNKVMPLLQPGILDETTRRKAIQKALESRRVPSSMKARLRLMRPAREGRSSPTSRPVPSR